MQELATNTPCPACLSIGQQSRPHGPSHCVPLFILHNLCMAGYITAISYHIRIPQVKATSHVFGPAIHWFPCSVVITGCIVISLPRHVQRFTRSRIQDPPPSSQQLPTQTSQNKQQKAVIEKKKHHLDSETSMLMMLLCTERST